MPLFGSKLKDNRDTVEPGTGHQDVQHPYFDARVPAGTTVNQGTNTYDRDTVEPGTGHQDVQHPYFDARVPAGTTVNQGTNTYDNNTNEPGTRHQHSQYPHTNERYPGDITGNQGTNTHDNSNEPRTTGHQQVQHPRTNERFSRGTTEGTGTQGTNAYDNSGRTYPPNHGAGPNPGPYGQPTNMSASAPHDHNVAPPDTRYHDSRVPGGTTVTKVTGKVESAIGSLVGSNTLKAKGLEKEREANLANLRGAELAEADRLEREAMMRRQRVGGAHPPNSNTGAGQFDPGNAPAHPGGYRQ